MILIQTMNDTDPFELIHVVGYIPSFLHEGDPRPAVEQLDERYVGGWRPFEGFEHSPVSHRLKYPGDPAMEPLAKISFRDETVYVYRYGWVGLTVGDKFEVARLD